MLTFEDVVFQRREPTETCKTHQLEHLTYFRTYVLSYVHVKKLLPRTRKANTPTLRITDAK